jgi:hypothetical protein
VSYFILGHNRERTRFGLYTLEVLGDLDPDFDQANTWVLRCNDTYPTALSLGTALSILLTSYRVWGNWDDGQWFSYANGTREDGFQLAWALVNLFQGTFAAPGESLTIYEPRTPPARIVLPDFEVVSARDFVSGSREAAIAHLDALVRLPPLDHTLPPMVWDSLSHQPEVRAVRDYTVVDAPPIGPIAATSPVKLEVNSPLIEGTPTVLAVSPYVPKSRFDLILRSSV